MGNHALVEGGKGAMTVYLFTGTPGSGKSLHMARLIYWRQRRGIPTIANFDIRKECINEGYFESIDNGDLTPQVLQDFALDAYERNLCKRREGAVNLFIDECQLLFNARQWNDSKRPDWIKFFSQHRKLGFDVYLISQFDTMIDKQIRALIEYEVKHRKMNNYGRIGRFVGFITRKPVIVCVNYWYPMGQRLSSETFVGTKRYFEMYDTNKI